MFGPDVSSKIIKKLNLPASDFQVTPNPPTLGPTKSTNPSDPSTPDLWSQNESSCSVTSGEVHWSICCQKGFDHLLKPKKKTRVDAVNQKSPLVLLEHKGRVIEPKSINAQICGFDTSKRPNDPVERIAPKLMRSSPVRSDSPPWHWLAKGMMQLWQTLSHFMLEMCHRRSGCRNAMLKNTKYDQTSIIII